GSAPSCPGSRASWAPRTSTIALRPGNSRGNGSMPAARRDSAFARRSATRRSRPPAGSCGSTAPASPSADGTRLDLHDLVLDRAARRRDADLLALLAAQERLPDGTLAREAAVPRVGL